GTPHSQQGPCSTPLEADGEPKGQSCNGHLARSSLRQLSGPASARLVLEINIRERLSRTMKQAGCSSTDQGGGKWRFAIALRGNGWPKSGGISLGQNKEELEVPSRSAKKKQSGAGQQKTRATNK